jgi:putative flippase GtrA
MVEGVRKLWRMAGTPEGLKLIKYTTVSAISALTSIVVLTIVYGVLQLWSAVISTLFANIVAGVPSYILNRRWVWGKSGRSHLWRKRPGCRSP